MKNEKKDSKRTIEIESKQTSVIWIKKPRGWGWSKGNPGKTMMERVLASRRTDIDPEYAKGVM